jgi:hypothetical protein
MQVGDLVKGKHIGWIGVIIEVNERDLSFYKSHTYLVQFATVNRQQWWQDYELEVICE